MSKKNKKMNVRIGATPKWFVGAGLMGIALALVYLWVDLKCKQVSQEIERCEREYAAVGKNYILEKARWESKLIPENLDRALLEHGLSMKFPTASQIVRVGADGRMFPGQPSEARAKRVLVPKASLSH